VFLGVSGLGVMALAAVMPVGCASNDTIPRSMPSEADPVAKSQSDAAASGAGGSRMMVEPPAPNGGAGETGTKTPSPDGPAARDSGIDPKVDATGLPPDAQALQGDSRPPGQRRLMVHEYPSRILEISDGKMVWEHKTESLTLMFTILPNGNIFYPHGGNKGGAKIVDRNHKILWSYTSKAGELLGGELMANGNALLGEGGPAALVEVNPAMEIVKSTPVQTLAGAHNQIRHVRKLPSGNVLVCLESEGTVREFDAANSVVFEFKGVQSVHDAVRLKNGNTLIGGGSSKRLIEVSPKGEVVWEFNAKDAPDLGLSWLCNVQVLATGNFLVTNWVGGGGGAGVHAFEVTRDKKVVWKLDDHKLIKSATTVIAIDE
jgi:hypothetical protein